MDHIESDTEMELEEMAEIEGKMGVLTEQQSQEYKEAFDMFDKDGSGSIDKEEIGSLLDSLHVQVPGYKLRELKEEYGETIEFDEFVEIVKNHSGALSGTQFLDMLTKTNVEHIGGISEGSAEGTTHSYSEAETAAFADWVNSQLMHDEELTGYLPIDSANNYKEMFDKVKDGVLLCKLINATVKDTIDMRAVNKKNLKVFTIHENQTLVINSAASIGCHLVNIGPEDLANGKQHLVLGLLWQVIRIGLFSNITLTNVPGLTKLLHEGEEISDLHKLSPEELLIRWVNYQLKEAQSDRRITNFSEDITDSVVYSVLLHCIAPGQSSIDHPNTYYSIDAPLKKADKVLRNAEKIGCKKFVRSKDIVEGNQKLNLAFVANLFNKYPNLPLLEENDDEINQENANAYREETDEERTYRNWMNSLGVNPFVTWLYSDLTNGLVLLQLYDSIQPGIVNWKKVNPIEVCKKKSAGYLKEIENCNYAVEIGKQMRFKIVAFGGKDLRDVSDSTELYTLGLVWQMMRAYTYSILARLAPEGGAPLTDNDILVWVNEKLTKNKKPNITSFKAGEISTSLPVIDLIDCISSKVVDYSQVNKGISDEDMMSNARYALSLARKIGAQIYALPKDLVEVKSKMVLTVFACLMACSLAKEKEEKKRPGKKSGKK